jgi:putative ABC transport system substrate-binding protein
MLLSRHTRRREFITLLGGAAVTWPCAAIAQTSPKMLRIGFVSGALARTEPVYVAIDRRLRELGYFEGQNLAAEFIELKGQFDRYDEAMKELVRRKVDIIFATGPEIALKSALAATDTIPIVFVAVDYDPLALGYVSSLARHTGNVTGVFLQQIELSVKRIQFIRDAFPDMRAAIVFWDAASADQWQATQSTGATLDLRLVGIELRGVTYDYEAALAQAPADHYDGLIVMTSPIFFRDRVDLAQLALRHRLASMFVFREWVEAGGLLSYGPSISGMFAHAVDYADRIANGTKPADLPVEQPTRFELVVNLKTAKAIGVTLPPALLVRADEVIE